MADVAKKDHRDKVQVLYIILKFKTDINIEQNMTTAIIFRMLGSTYCPFTLTTFTALKFVFHF